MVCNMSRGLGRSAPSSEQQDAGAQDEDEKRKSFLNLPSNYRGKPPKGDVI